MTGAWQISDSTGQIRELQADLIRYFQSRLKGKADPRDFAADVWLAAGKSFEGRSSLRHYLFVIARRAVADHWRRVFRQPELVEFADDLPANVLGCETALQNAASEFARREVVERALAQVDYPHQDVVRSWLAGRDPYQIADELGIPYNTVRSRFYRGRRQLMQFIADDPDYDGQ